MWWGECCGLVSGVAHVNITSDTGANAKNMAMAEARRQIIVDVLTPYAVASDLIYDTRDADLANLISATSIDGEKLSATSYAADIKMTVDGAAAKKFLDDNNVPNTIGMKTVADDTFIADVEIAGGPYQWAEFMKAMKDANIIPEIRSISGTTVTVAVPQNISMKFLSAVIAHGLTVD